MGVNYPLQRYAKFRDNIENPSENYIFTPVTQFNSSVDNHLVSH